MDFFFFLTLLLAAAFAGITLGFVIILEEEKIHLSFKQKWMLPLLIGFLILVSLWNSLANLRKNKRTSIDFFRFGFYQLPIGLVILSVILKANPRLIHPTLWKKQYVESIHHLSTLPAFPNKN